MFNRAPYCIYILLILATIGCSPSQKPENLTKLNVSKTVAMEITYTNNQITTSQPSQTQFSSSSTPYLISTTLLTSTRQRDAATISPTPTAVLTKTPQMKIETNTPSWTATPNATHTPVQINQAIPVCAGGGKTISIPWNFGIDGTIIYQSRDNQGLFTIGGTPLQKGQIETKQKISVFGFSPDGNWLAYAPEIPHSGSDIVFSTPRMVLLSAEGKRIEQEINIDGLEKELYDRCSSCSGYKFYDSAGEWISNNLIYMHLGATGEMDGGEVGHLPKVFDPFTGSWQDQWFGNLPDLYEIIPDRFGIDHIKLSPDLTRVLYPAKTGGILLRSLVQSAKIWSDDEFYRPWGEIIQWSPDSKMVAVLNINVESKDREFLLVSRDGDVTQIVSAAYPQSDFYLGSLGWSPDGRYLAYTESYNGVNLYLFDTQMGNYVYRCQLLGMSKYSQSLVWSPDSQWIAIGDKPSGSMHLLNVQSGEVIELLVNAIPVGWSKNFPVEWP